MIELPEAITLSGQLRKTVSGKAIARVLPPTKPHKFCWFSGDAADYDEKIKGSLVTGADAFGLFAELAFSNGCRLCVNDGVNVRLVSVADTPKDYQLSIELADGTALVCTVAMYGGICLHDGDYDNEYYLKSLHAISPFDDAFPTYYYETLDKSKPNLSAKAFLATEQRFPGIGNGTAQDILFAAGLHPRRKLSTFSKNDADALLSAIRTVLRDMTDRGGRDTEKDLFGNPGGYATKMSKNALPFGCPVCDGEIVKENYLGGSVYYCPHCQPL